MRVVFMGTPDFAVSVLDALIREHEVAGVVTRPDRKKGRGKAVSFPPVKEKALAHGIPVWQPEKVKDEEFVRVLRSLEPEAVIVAAFGQILPPSILSLPPFGCINVHASLLPKYRGAAPIQRAIIDGETETGVTIMYMEKGLDTGDMIDSCKVAIDPDETGDSLHDKLAAAGGPLLLRALRSLEEGKAVRTPQDDSKSSYAGMLTRDLGRIDWTMDAAAIERLVRGLNSWPSAYTFYGGRTIKIWRAQVLDEDRETAPGTVVFTDRESLHVACGKGTLILKEVQLQGKKRMSAHDFLLGNKISTGMVFGAEA